MSDFEVIEGLDVDLLEPFPVSQIGRIWGWTRPNGCRTQIDNDYGVKTKEEFVANTRSAFEQPGFRSFALIDKNHRVDKKQDAPLVGVIMMEAGIPTNRYLHIATRRKASVLVAEATKLAGQRLFDSDPDLLRLSAWITENNKVVRLLLKRIGFVQEGTIPDMLLIGDKPTTALHFGMTRTHWEEICRQQQFQSLPPSEDRFSAESEAVENKGSKKRPVPGLPIPLRPPLALTEASP